MANKPNPNGANQYNLDPRQKLCWDFYIDPRSETFGNATQSAIKAGYEPDYADQMSTVEWFKGKVRRLNLLDKAETRLEEVLDAPLYTPKGTIDKGVVTVATFVAETLGKSEGYAKRSEISGPDGGAIVIDSTAKELADNAINEFLDNQGNTGV